MPDIEGRVVRGDNRKVYKIEGDGGRGKAPIITAWDSGSDFGGLKIVSETGKGRCGGEGGTVFRSDKAVRPRP